MADAAPAKGGSGSRGLLWVLIVLLLAAVWWLASERNARKYTLSAQGGVLLVSRGRYFPTSTALIGPDDPDGKIYAGIELPPGARVQGETEYEDQGALDRGIYDLLNGPVHALAKKGDPASSLVAETLAKRLAALRGLSAEELADLTALRAELAFWSAGGDVRAAAQSLLLARRKLEEVRANGGEHAPAAGPIAAQLDPLAAQLGALAAALTASAPVAIPTIATPSNSPAPAAADAGEAAPAPVGPGGAAPAGADPLAAPARTAPAPAPALPAPAAPGAAAAPPADAALPAPAPAAPAQPERQGASAPGSVSSGASRGN